MPSPIGHTLAGLALAELIDAPGGRSSWRTSLIANAPDVDMLPGLVDGQQAPNAQHGKATHSLGAALLVGAAVGTYDRARGHRFLRGFVQATAAYTSHLVLDYLGKESSDGMPLLWPLSRRRIGSPHVWFRTIISKSRERGFVAGLFTRANVGAIAREVASLGPFLWLARRRRKRRSAQSSERQDVS